MIRNIFTTFICRIITTLLSFVVLILTTNFLGPEGRGIISLFTTSTGLINLFSGFIGGSALVYLIPRNKNKTFIIQIFFLSYIWTILVSGIFTEIFSLTKTISSDLVIHIFFLGILTSLLSFQLMILLAFEKIIYQNFIFLLQTLLTFLIFGGFIFIFHVKSVMLFIRALYFSYIISFLLSFVFLLKNIPQQKSSVSLCYSLKGIIKYGFVCQLSNVIQYLNYRLSYYVLNYYIATAVVGIYSVGVVISESIWMFARSISLVQYTKIANTKDVDYSKNITLKLANLSFIITSGILILLILVPTSLFSIIFGKDFSQIKSIIFYLAPGISIFGYTTIISHYFAGVGRYIVNTIASFLGLIITLIFNFILVPQYGYRGAAISASLSYLTTGLFLIFSFIKETRIGVDKLFFSPKELYFIIIEKIKGRL